MIHHSRRCFLVRRNWKGKYSNSCWKLPRSRIVMRNTYCPHQQGSVNRSRKRHREFSFFSILDTFALHLLSSKPLQRHDNTIMCSSYGYKSLPFLHGFISLVDMILGMIRIDLYFSPKSSTDPQYLFDSMAYSMTDAIQSPLLASKQASSSDIGICAAYSS